MTLPADISRCQGIDADNLPCDIRHKCERYLTLMDAFATAAPIARMLCAHTDSGTDGSAYPFFIPEKP